jgi:hypothetical protein
LRSDLSLKDIFSSFQNLIAAFAVDEVMMAPQNALGFEASGIMQGLDEGGEKSPSFGWSLK